MKPDIPELIERLVDAPPPPGVHRLSTDLKGLLREAEGRDLTVGELEATLQGRGFALFILILSAPFIIPTPGLSVPFGIAISLLGLRLALGQKPQLPGFILRKRMSHGTLKKIISPILRLIEKIEKHIKPRMHYFEEHPRAINLIGLGIMSAGFILSLPLPIPFSNGLPAISIMALAAGMMERDGLLVLIGHTLGVLSWLYLLLWWEVILAVLHRCAQWFS